MSSIELLGVKTNPAKYAQNLGVIFDKNFTFLSHISAVCSSCFYHIRDLRRIRRYLDLDSAKLLATALVSSRLDYCNSLLYGIADSPLMLRNCFVDFAVEHWFGCRATECGFAGDLGISEIWLIDCNQVLVALYVRIWLVPLISSLDRLFYPLTWT